MLVAVAPNYRDAFRCLQDHILKRGRCKASTELDLSACSAETTPIDQTHYGQHIEVPFLSAQGTLEDYYSASCNI